jgi:large subunit ribosomal protein L32
MSVPAQRRSSSFTKRRRSHLALSKPTTKKCDKCGETVMPHRACTKCGTYKGRQVLDVDKRLRRATRKK